MLTSALGRAPTDAEIEQAKLAPWSLANIHNTLEVGQSTFSLNPGDDIQAGIDKLVANGGGVLYLNPGTYPISNDILVPSNIAIHGLLRDSTIIDFGGGAYSIKSIGANGYTDGTVSITAGTTTVTGTTTVFVSSMVGQTIFLGNSYYLVSSITSETELEIDTPYSGDNFVDSRFAIADPITSLDIRTLTIQNSSSPGIQVAYSTGGFIFSNFNIYNCAKGIRVDFSLNSNIDLGGLDGNGINLDFYYHRVCTLSNSFIDNATTGEGLRLDHSGGGILFDNEMN